MYGYFECEDCDNKWQSAHVYPKRSGGYYGQKCRECDVMCYPYKTEETVCSMCGETARFCDCDKPESDPNKPHRSDLCEKCRNGRPCCR